MKKDLRESSSLAKKPLNPVWVYVPRPLSGALPPAPGKVHRGTLLCPASRTARRPPSQACIPAWAVPSKLCSNQFGSSAPVFLVSDRTELLQRVAYVSRCSTLTLKMRFYSDRFLFRLNFFLCFKFGTEKFLSRPQKIWDKEIHWNREWRLPFQVW